MPKALKAIIITILIILVTYIGTVKIFNVQEKIMKKIYPKTYSEYVTDYSKEYDVDPLLVYAVIKAESLTACPLYSVKKVWYLIFRSRRMFSRSLQIRAPLPERELGFIIK